MALQSIQSQRSLQTHLLAFGLIGMGLGLAALSVAAWLQGTQPVWSAVLFGLLGLFMAVLGVDEGWLSGLEVSPQRLRIRSFGRWEEHSLDQIEAVDGLRDLLGGGMQIVLVGAARDPIRVPLRRYTNSGQLAQALLDAVWLQNKELIVMPRLLRRLGQPPFGVLAGKKSGR